MLAKKDNGHHFYVPTGISIRVGCLLKNVKLSPEKIETAQTDSFNREL